jgi:hypothetical protein
MAQPRIHLVDEDSIEGNVYQGSAPAVRQDWRVDQHPLATRDEMAAYRVAHHGPRIATLVLEGMAKYSRRAGEIVSEDPYMAPLATKLDRETGHELVGALRRYIRGSLY